MKRTIRKFYTAAAAFALLATGYNTQNAFHPLNSSAETTVHSGKIPRDEQKTEIDKASAALSEDIHRRQDEISPLHGSQDT